MAKKFNAADRAILDKVAATLTEAEVTTLDEVAGDAIKGLPTYADNTAAGVGGLVAGDLYRTATGVVMVTY